MEDDRTAPHLPLAEELPGGTGSVALRSLTCRSEGDSLWTSGWFMLTEQMKLQEEFFLGPECI